MEEVVALETDEEAKEVATELGGTNTLRGCWTAISGRSAYRTVDSPVRRPLLAMLVLGAAGPRGPGPGLGPSSALGLGLGLSIGAGTGLGPIIGVLCTCG